MAGEIIEGDLKFTWKKDNEKEVLLAKKAFDEYIVRGWLAIGEKSGKRTQIFTFDPNLDQILLAPIAVGG